MFLFVRTYSLRLHKIEFSHLRECRKNITSGHSFLFPPPSPLLWRYVVPLIFRCPLGGHNAATQVGTSLMFMGPVTFVGSLSVEL